MSWLVFPVFIGIYIHPPTPTPPRKFRSNTVRCNKLKTRLKSYLLLPGDLAGVGGVGADPHQIVAAHYLAHFAKVLRSEDFITHYTLATICFIMWSPRVIPVGRVHDQGSPANHDLGYPGIHRDK